MFDLGDSSPGDKFTIVIAVSTAVVVSTMFLFGVLVGVYRMKTKQANNTVTAAHSVDTPATSETAAGVELERQHEYEDITLYRPKEDMLSDTFTSNVAYGCI